MYWLLHRRDPLGGLEPAFAVAVVTIDPVLTVGRRLAGLQQARLFGGSRRSGFPGSGIEQGSKGIRRCRRRETCEKEKSGKAKSQMTGHGNPRCCAPPGHDLWPRPGSQCDSNPAKRGIHSGPEPGSGPEFRANPATVRVSRSGADVSAISARQTKPAASKFVPRSETEIPGSLHEKAIAFPWTNCASRPTN